MSIAARRSNMSAEEQEEAAERNAEDQRRHRNNVAEREADERREEQQGGFHDCWNLTEDQILPFLKQKGNNPEELDRYFADIHRNPSKAVLLYYLNSGHGRFQQHKEFDANCRGKDFDIDDLCEEIEAEQLDGEELHNLCERFFARHSFTDNSLWSCGMCGLRELQSKEVAHESKLFKRITLSVLEEDQGEVIRYTEEQ